MPCIQIVLFGSENLINSQASVALLCQILRITHQTNGLILFAFTYNIEYYLNYDVSKQRPISCKIKKPRRCKSINFKINLDSIDFLLIFSMILYKVSYKYCFEASNKQVIFRIIILITITLIIRIQSLLYYNVFMNAENMQIWQDPNWIWCRYVTGDSLQTKFLNTAFIMKIVVLLFKFQCNLFH